MQLKNLCTSFKRVDFVNIMVDVDVYNKRAIDDNDVDGDFFYDD